MSTKTDPEQTPYVSVIIPTLNSSQTLEACLASLERLEYPPDFFEVIVVDGHSSDDTAEVCERHRVKIAFEEVGTRAEACNVGIETSKGDIVAFTDADCVVDRRWLSILATRMQSLRADAVGGPNLTPDDDTELAKCVGYALDSAALGLDTVQARAQSVETRTSSVSGCNSAYRAEVLKRTRFNSYLGGCEDAELNLRLLQEEREMWYVPDAVVYHYRRPSVWRLWKQMKNYGVVRARTFRLHSGRKQLRYLTPSAAVAVLSLLLGLALLGVLPSYLGYAVVFAITGFYALSCVRPALSRLRIRYVLLTPLLTFLIHVAWEVGFLQGLLGIDGWSTKAWAIDFMRASQETATKGVCE